MPGFGPQIKVISQIFAARFCGSPLNLRDNYLGNSDYLNQ
jgi:hypothetical protein